MVQSRKVISPYIPIGHKRRGEYMQQNFINKTLNIGGMTCVNCENKIERELISIDGIVKVRVTYSKGTAAITYDSSKTSIIEIESTIETMGYTVIKSGQEVKKKKFTGKLIIASVVLVVVLGVFMLSNGMVLRGIGLPATSNAFAESQDSSYIATAVVKDGTQFVTTILSSGGYDPINIQAGIPVQWTIQADESAINGCNNEIIIPKYNIKKILAPGDNIIEFTPTESGTVVFSCWMGMIQSEIYVYDNLEDQSQVLPAGDASNLPSCCPL